jgi:hypothetical protein
MERTCSHCHAVLAPETQADWCPACGGALIERTSLPETGLPVSGLPGNAKALKPEIDHRGIVLPRRHALGGVITPQ